MKALSRLLAAGLVAASLAATPAKAELGSITIGTNPTGSVYFLLGGGIAKLFQEELGIRSTAQPQGGSSVYLPMINSGEMDLGLASTIDSAMAYQGLYAFPEEMRNVRAMGVVWEIPYAYVTRAETGIETMADLEGKRVMGDMPTNVSLTELNKAMLETAGLSVDDVDFARSGGLIDGIDAVKQGRADAAPVATSMPALMEAHSAVSGGLRIISNGQQASDEFYNERVPGTRVRVVEPNERRPYIKGDTEIVSYDAMLVTHKDQTEDDIYLLTKTLHENWEQMQQDYAPMRGVSKEEFAIVRPTVPYHAGAVRYLKEAGLWTDAHEAHQASFSN